MNKTAVTEYYRLFLIEKLPDPLTPASSHIQIFDNYIDGTRMRLRLVRDPGTKAWTRILQQRFTVGEDDASVTKLAEIHLNDAEYSLFEQFEGHEIRKNRYFHEFDRVNVAFDIYLGELWGLNTALVEFSTGEAMREFEPPPFAVIEITGDPFFRGENLVQKGFADVQAEVARLAPSIRTAAMTMDE
jgi:CYTH domain-containing protein